MVNEGILPRAALRQVEARLTEAGCPDADFLSLIHISEPTRRTPISYAVFCLKKKNKTTISYTHLRCHEKGRNFAY